MTDSEHTEYDEKLIAVCEAVWGKGYISPGGPDEVERIVGDVDLAGKHVLDVGCGSGGISRFLATRYQPARITGVDVEEPLVHVCNREAEQQGLADRLEYIHIEPGPLPFDGESFDVVFTKDSMIHIADKDAICGEVFRVLRPGGEFIASDWMRGEGPVTPEMEKYVALEELSFGMGNQQQYRDALEGAGFEDIRFDDRNAWYRDVAREELQRLTGELFEPLVAQVGREYTEHCLETWKAMLVVLDSGEHRPTHWYSRKPD